MTHLNLLTLQNDPHSISSPYKITLLNLITLQNKPLNLISLQNDPPESRFWPSFRNPVLIFNRYKKKYLLRVFLAVTKTCVSLAKLHWRSLRGKPIVTPPDSAQVVRELTGSWTKEKPLTGTRLPEYVWLLCNSYRSHWSQPLLSYTYTLGRDYILSHC